MTPLALLISVFLASLLGGLLPFINTELIVLAAAAAAPSQLLLPLILIAATTQMVAKTVLYLGGRGLMRFPNRRLRFDAAVRNAKRLEHGGSVFLFVSAATGFPPFYLMSIASGAMKLPFGRFLVLGFIGRLVRFGAVMGAPHLIRTATQ
jgi:membrane protein YqaA with SNARE-associated domain